jgi:hypothetical protein
MVPAEVIRPILSTSPSVNHSAPSDPVAMALGSVPGGCEGVTKNLTDGGSGGSASNANNGQLRKAPTSKTSMRVRFIRGFVYSNWCAEAWRDVGL